MVRAILDGTKSQTRRVLKRKGGTAGLDTMCPRSENEFVDIVFRELEKECPYGASGDRLWVKETFAHATAEVIFTSDERRPVGSSIGMLAYRADMETEGKPPCGKKWRPSIFMPRKLSRITLEIISVRVERLKSISHLDCIAEGLPDGPHRQRAYWDLWDSINGKGASELNPWVWCLEFKKL